MQLQEGISLELNQRLVGRRLRVLVEQVGPEGAVGRSYRDAPEVDGQVRLTGAVGVKAGEFVEVEVTGAEVHDLVGASPLLPPPAGRGTRAIGTRLRRHTAASAGGYCALADEHAKSAPT